MSSAEQHPNDLGAQTTTNSPVETIYTTVESQHDRTDWLTVVSNLRQINRQLVEEIARLEQALASTKQSLHNRKEENQTHEITILQQQDELRITHDQVGALFQQLETSHQIGQRQQTLIETLSQQLEITQAIVPQIEAEHEELTQKYQQQSQKLTKTEQVAIELHRRLKLQTNTTATSIPAAVTTVNSASGDISPSSTVEDTSTLPLVAVQSEIDDIDIIDLDPHPPAPDVSALETASSDSNISTAEIDPAPPLVPLQIADMETFWTPSAPLAAKTILSPPKLADPSGWREAIASNSRYHYTLETFPTPTPPPPDTVDKESTPIADPLTKSAPNWPAPTLDLDPLRDNQAELSISKNVKIDLPKFPKKQEG